MANLTKPVVEVLLVDDEPLDVLSTERFLSTLPRIKTGVAVGTSLQEAFDLAGSRSFDVILLDLNLPDSQGLATLEQVLEVCLETPVVVLTGADETELGIRAISLGAQDYLAKSDMSSSLLDRTLTYALERFRLQANVRKTNEALLVATAKEQIRIGLDLHDGICQMQVAAGMKSKALSRVLQENQNPLFEQAAEIADMLQDISSSMRATIKGLVPPELSTAGLKGGLHHLVKCTSDDKQGLITLDVDAKVEVHNMGVAQQLYRIAQEAVQNAIRHGQATSIHLSFKREGSRAVLTVRDNGTGFSVEDTDSNEGNGLRSMRIRAEAMNASYCIESELQRGTTVRCAVALQRMMA